MIPLRLLAVILLALAAAPASAEDEAVPGTQTIRSILARIGEGHADEAVDVLIGDTQNKVTDEQRQGLLKEFTALAVLGAPTTLQAVAVRRLGSRYLLTRYVLSFAKGKVYLSASAYRPHDRWLLGRFKLAANLLPNEDPLRADAAVGEAPEPKGLAEVARDTGAEALLDRILAEIGGGHLDDAVKLSLTDGAQIHDQKRIDELLASDGMKEVKRAFGVLFSSAGELIGREPVLARWAGADDVVLSYVVYYENSPAVFRLRYERRDGHWLLSQLVPMDSKAIEPMLPASAAAPIPVAADAPAADPAKTNF